MLFASMYAQYISLGISKMEIIKKIWVDSAFWTISTLMPFHYTVIKASVLVLGTFLIFSPNGHVAALLWVHTVYLCLPPYRAQVKIVIDINRYGMNEWKSRLLFTEQKLRSTQCTNAHSTLPFAILLFDRHSAHVIIITFSNSCVSNRVHKYDPLVCARNTGIGP